MQVSRTKQKDKSAKKKLRFVKGQTTTSPRKRVAKSNSPRKAPERNSVKKTRIVPAAKPSRSDKKKEAARAPRAVIADLPGWSDLKNSKNDRAAKPAAEPRLLASMSTLRFSLGILAVAALFTLYVGHVQATQDLLDDVYQARKENLALHLELNVLQGEYDTRTGPAVIYERANALGLREDKETASPIFVDTTRP
jgi:hypothetical protein